MTLQRQIAYGNDAETHTGGRCLTVNVQRSLLPTRRVLKAFKKT